MKTRPAPEKRKSRIDLRDLAKSRRAWQPDWEEIDKDMPRINRELRRKHGKPPVNG